METLQQVISFNQMKLENTIKVIDGLQNLIDTGIVTKDIHNEIEMQSGERDYLFSTVKYLKELESEKDEIVLKRKGEDLISVINRNIKAYR